MKEQKYNELPINLKILWKGCILASIAHAIMVTKYPLLSFEHSWDNFNYNIQDGSGQRGTITFYNKYCIAAFRNEYSERMEEVMSNSEYLKKYFFNCKYEILEIANRETFQYLLDETNYGISPCITSVFWGEFMNNKVYSIDDINSIFLNGGSLIKYHLLSYNEAIEKWIKYYNMNSNEIFLLEFIFRKKIKEYNTPIFLSKKEISLLDINNYEGFKEAKISFSEMGIYFN